MPRIKKGRGPFGTTELPKELEEYYDILEDRADRLFARFRREERNILEVCRTIAGIEGDGLTCFWEGGDNPKRIMQAFREIGCESIARNLEESKWITKVLKRGVTVPDGQYKFTEEEMQKYTAIEHAVMDELQEAADKAHAYILEKGLGTGQR